MKQQQQMMVHPAWAAVEDRLTDNRRWIARLAGKEAGYHDWQIALAMAVAGFGDDLVINATEDGPTRYGFPPYKIPLNEERDETKPVNPTISPRALLDFYAQHGISDDFDSGLRLMGATERRSPAPATLVSNGQVHANGVHQ